MTIITYKTILDKAKSIKSNVEKEYKLGEPSTWSYYISKCILNHQKNVTKIKVNAPSNSSGEAFSRRIYYSSYIDMAERLCKYTETHNQLPNYITISNKNMKASDYTYMFSRILVYLDTNNKYPQYAEVNSKSFTKPTEYPNKVYGLWVKYIKTKPKMLDDVCDYVKDHFDYEFYYDDQKSNEQVLSTKAGNCTDLLQMLTNMADAMDYDWEVIHTQCRQSGTGHVYGRFKKKGTTNWFTRDIACIADETRYCVWCEVPDRGNLIAKNPSWFLQNRNR